MFQILKQFALETGFYALFDTSRWMSYQIGDFSFSIPGELIMIVIACFFIYLAIAKGYEPYLLIPIAFGMLLVNLPLGGMMDEGGLISVIYVGIEKGLYPPLIFLCIGASTDFGPLIANPKSILLGAAAQLGIFVAFTLAIILGFTGPEAASIGIIGGADGPTALLVTSILANHLLGPIAIAAYSYMALVPVIQPPIMKLMTTKEERSVVMKQLRPVSQKEKIIFPIAVTIVTILLVPSSAPLIGMLMLGNLCRESKVVPNLTATFSNTLLYIITILLGVSVGAKAQAVYFLTPKTLGILLLGMIAFSFGTFGGVLLGKLMYKLSNGEVNPLIGSAGVSAVPMAARVSHKVGQEENPANFLLMHAMGPNVAGVIGSAVAAGVLIVLFR